MSRGCAPRIYLNLGCLGFGCLTTLAVWAAVTGSAAVILRRVRRG